MSDCNYTKIINDTDCIGDSRITLNSNFTNLDSNLCALSATNNILQNKLNSLITLVNTITGNSIITTYRGTVANFTPTYTAIYVVQVNGTVSFPGEGGGDVTFTINNGIGSTNVLRQYVAHRDANSGGDSPEDMPINLTWSGTLNAGTAYTFTLKTYATGTTTAYGSILTTNISDGSSYNPYWVIQQSAII